VAKASGTVAPFWVIIGFDLQIGDVNRSPVEDGAAGYDRAR